MTETRAQRTIVKSPPELWAELSDPDSLARHLGELGEIRITRTEPETTVAWEGEQIRGTVELRASGWGTKVTLTAVGTPPEPSSPQPAAARSEPEDPAPPAPPAGRSAPDPVPRAARSAPDPVPPAARSVPNPEPAASALPVGEVPEPAPFSQEPDETAAAAMPAAAAPVPEPRRGFFARLFDRRPAPADSAPARGEPVVRSAVRRPTMAPEASDAAEAIAVEPPRETVADEPQPEPLATVPDEPPLAPSPPEPSPPARDAVVEPEPEPPPQARRGEPVAVLDAERTEAVLSAVLDTLGAAHHRPFSR